MFSIGKREFLGYFRTPIAYVFLAVFLLAAIGLPWFLGAFFQRNEASLASFFVFLPWVYLFLIPAAGMRLWSEEKRSGTWELLLTHPVTVPQAVIAKFLAAWLFIGLALVLTFPLGITVAYLGDPDWGPLFAGYFGALLMAGAYLAICSLASALTKNQVIAFVLSTSICLILVLLGWSVFNQLLLGMGLPVRLVDTIANFSFITHFEDMGKGLVALRDVLFFASLTAATLWLNCLVLER
jgi:ABC-2 type transport system permease protein